MAKFRSDDLASITKSALFFILLSLAMAEEPKCARGTIMCPPSPGGTAPDSPHCIDLDKLCDGTRDCSTGDDEVVAFCNYYYWDDQCSRGQMFCSTYDDNTCWPWGDACACMPWGDACAQPSCNANSTICQILSDRILPASPTDEKLSTPAPPTLDMTQVSTFLAAGNCSADNANLESGTCPMLYTNVSGHCVAFLPFELSWPDAGDSCRSVGGALAQFDDVQLFADMAQYLVGKDFSSDFWIGGFFNIQKEAWTWSSTGRRLMPRGTPYWALRYSASCSERESVSLGNHSGCYHYQQAPIEHIPGFCAALNFEFMYYISAHNCFNTKRPMCLLQTEKILY